MGNEQQSSYSSTINQLKKDLENKNDDSVIFVKLQEELKGSIETMSSMKTAHETELSKKVEEIKVATANLREESNNSLEQKILLVVKDKDKELEEKEAGYKKNTKAIETKLSKAIEVAKKFKDAAVVKDKNNKDSELSLNKMKEDKDKLTSEIKILRETLQKSTEKEQSSLKQITNANTKFKKESKAKQTEISKLTTEKDEVSSTLLQLREEKDSSALKYKDQLQDLKKVHDKDLKGKLNEHQSSYTSTINQLKKDLENKNYDSAKFVKLQEELKGSIETMSSMKTAHETELNKKVEEIKMTTASLREESNNSLEQKILLVVKDQEKELEEKEAGYKKNTKAIETKLSKALEVAKKFKDAAAAKDKSNKDSELSLNKTKEDKDKLTSEIKILRETLQKSTEKEQSSLKQITNANTKFEKESKAKQTEIS